MILLLRATTLTKCNNMSNNNGDDDQYMFSPACSSSRHELRLPLAGQEEGCLLLPVGVEHVRHLHRSASISRAFVLPRKTVHVRGAMG